MFNKAVLIQKLKRYPGLYQMMRLVNLKSREGVIRMGKIGRMIICLWDYILYYKKLPHLRHPVTLGEKIQWIKLYYYNPLYTQCADKIQVREYVSEKLRGGEDIRYPVTYRIYDSAEQLRLSELPEKFVLKPNHSSNKVIICKNKSLLNEEEVRKTAKRWLKENFYYHHGEWQYRDICPRLICEELLEDDIIDYRIFCFDSKPEFVRVTRHDKLAASGYVANFYDREWKEMGCLLKGDKKEIFPRPQKWKDMLIIAEKLAEDFFFVRVDLYECNGEVFFAELTFTPNNGLLQFEPKQFDRAFGDMLHLPIKQ